MVKPYSIKIEKDKHTVRLHEEQYMLEHMSEIDLSTMAGRIKYYRIRQGITKAELSRRIGMKDPSAYAKTYEKPDANVMNLEQVRKICKALNVEEELIFDDYMSFLASDYILNLLDVQARLGINDSEMDQKLGMSKGQFGKWVAGKSVPSRSAVERIEEMGKAKR